MYKLKLFLLPVAWLLAFMALACAPPDDDDRSSAPSKPTINNAIYDFATALLTVQGSNLSPTEAQIQTIVVDGVAFSSYTADDDATGPDNSNLAKGKYRIKSDGTKLWLRLTDQHKAALQTKLGSNGLKKGLLTSSGAWAGLNTPKDLDVSNVPENKQSKVSDDNQPSKQTEEAEQAEQVEQAEEESRKLPEAEQAEEESPKQPKDEQVEQVEEESPKAAITGASYHVGTALLTLQGTDLGSATQAQIQTIVVDGVALSSYTATATGADSRGLAKGKYRIKNDGTALWLYLTDDDKDALNGKTGMDSNGLKDGLLTSTGAWAGLDTAKPLTVSGNPAPAITRATYDVNRGVLVITGTNLPTTVAEWDFSKLTLVSGDRTNRLTLPRFILGISKATGSAVSATSLTITLSGSVKDKADAILVNDGVRDEFGAYNLEAAAGFAGGSAEDTTNPITVSGYTIINASYSANTGELTIYGRGLPTTIAEWDFSKLTIVSRDGSKRYTLPRHSTVGANRATGTVAAIKGLKITLSGSVKQKAEAIMQERFRIYKFEAAAGFVPGSPEDPTVILTSTITRRSK